MLTAHGHGLNLEDLDAQLIIERFDRDGDGFVTLNEWHEMITPTY
jgi:Ca2+-binding EF-hand superfamily protein